MCNSHSTILLLPRHHHHHHHFVFLLWHFSALRCSTALRVSLWNQRMIMCHIIIHCGVDRWMDSHACMCECGLWSKCDYIIRFNCIMYNMSFMQTAADRGAVSFNSNFSLLLFHVTRPTCQFLCSSPSFSHSRSRWSFLRPFAVAFFGISSPFAWCLWICGLFPFIRSSVFGFLALSRALFLSLVHLHWPWHRVGNVERREPLI